jgi:hypothetical protein
MQSSSATDPEMVLETLETIARSEALLRRARAVSQKATQRLVRVLAEQGASCEQPLYGPRAQGLKARP